MKVAASPVDAPAAQAPSPYLNTRLDVAYVGSDACRKCHAGHDASFRHTGMGRSSAIVDLTREPPDGEFFHKASQRTYQVVRREGQMWHRELRSDALDPAAEPVVMSEYPVKYVVGSGRHSLTYVFEADGYLMESPITWYTSRKAWDMSPGYDRPNHSSFEREVGEACLVCHMGTVKTLDRSLHRVEVGETTISCEQCHGPGQLHAARHVGKAGETTRATTASDQEQPIDYTIVNPARLSRELSEAVCEQCHLRGAAMVVNLGKDLRDFRPGLKLEDYRQVFRLDPPDSKMTVVGHVEQMVLSKCYQKSDRFTCLTCHNPHGQDGSLREPQPYIDVCLECHTRDKCRGDADKRAATKPGDNCLQCHMPTSDTDIPHLAFTHHRVGVHHDFPSATTKSAATLSKDAKIEAEGQARAKATEAASADPPKLVPFCPITSIGPRERLRSLGLAYIDAAKFDEDDERRNLFQQYAFRLLSDYRSAGQTDGVVESWLARLRFDNELGEVEAFARRALQDHRIEGLDKCNALFLLADAQYARGRYDDALTTLKELHGLRRHSLQWLLQAQIYKKTGDDDRMDDALRQALKINPHVSSAQQRLAESERKRGNEQQAREHERRK